MKNSQTIGKGAVMKFLKDMGVTLQRVNSKDGRVWQTNTGRTFETLAQAYIFFNKQKGKKETKE